MHSHQSMHRNTEESISFCEKKVQILKQNKVIGYSFLSEHWLLYSLQLSKLSFSYDYLILGWSLSLRTKFANVYKCSYYSVIQIDLKIILDVF